MPDPDRPAPPAEAAGVPLNSSDPEETPRRKSDVDAVTGTVELLRQAELQAQEHRDAWLRAKAEADNIRKRGQIELANAYKYAIETLAAELLPVKDSLEAT